MKQMQLKCNLDLVQMQLDAPCIEQLSKVFNQVEVEAELGNYFKVGSNEHDTVAGGSVRTDCFSGHKQNHANGMDSDRD